MFPRKTQAASQICFSNPMLLVFWLAISHTPFVIVIFYILTYPADNFNLHLHIFKFMMQKIKRK